jgi:glycosyltransferase involved in cell wall biosynthesis
MNPLVSIIVPIYNSEKYIADTVQSCVDQVHTNIEIILVNDGSTDKTEEIILSFKDDRIRYFKTENKGGCEARNYGISQAKGQLFQFLDHDDVLGGDKISSQILHYEKHGDDYIYSCKMGSISGDNRTIDEGYELYNRDFEPLQYFETVFDQFGKYITTGAWLVPSKIIKSTHGWDGKAGLNDDGEYFMRIILASKGIIFSNTGVFYFRRDVVGSLSKQFGSKEVYVKWFYSYKSYVKYFLKAFAPDKAKELSRKALSRYYCASYPNYPDLLAECKQELNKLGFKTPVAHGGKYFNIMASIIGVENTLKIYAYKNKLKKA